MITSHWFSGLLLAFSMTTASVPESNFLDFVFNKGSVESVNYRVSLSADLVYDNMNLDKYGVSREAVNYAIQGYNNLMNENKVVNSRYLTIVDFSRSLHQKRFFLLDLENQEVVMSTYVMHGKNSGKDEAVRFSNKVDSYQSSLGFFLTNETYTGKRGYSLRLQGLEKDFNNNAMKRAIVLHGSNYISDSRAKRNKNLRSEGCPAIPMPQAPEVIDLVKGGSVLFIYHPSEKYLQESPVLNS